MFGRPVLTGCLLGLLLTGCQSGPPPPVFTERDGQDFAAICDGTAAPIAFSGLQYQASGHLKMVLADRRHIGPQEFLDLHVSGDVTRLKSRAALIVLEHINSHVPGGAMVLLFHPEGTQDLFTTERMLAESGTVDAHLTPRATFPFHWYENDQESDYLQDSLVYIGLEAKGALVNDRGEPQYVWRWTGP